jgi:hypothetical protein
MQTKAEQDRLLQYLKEKERKAQIAKEKGMTSVYSNLLLEIDLVKSKLKRLTMGSK